MHLTYPIIVITFLCISQLHITLGKIKRLQSIKAQINFYSQTGIKVQKEFLLFHVKFSNQVFVRRKQNKVSCDECRVSVYSLNDSLSFYRDL